MMKPTELTAAALAYYELESKADAGIFDARIPHNWPPEQEADNTTAPAEQGWLRTEHEKHGNRHDRRAERAKQRKLLKQVKRTQARMKADKPGI